MRLISGSIAIIAALMIAITVYAGSGGPGTKCNGDHDCEFTCRCESGACVKKSSFSGGSSGKEGKSCFSDSDCIGSGKCVEGKFGKKVCSGS